MESLINLNNSEFKNPFYSKVNFKNGTLLLKLSTVSIVLFFLLAKYNNLLMPGIKTAVFMFLLHGFSVFSLIHGTSQGFKKHSGGPKGWMFIASLAYLTFTILSLIPLH